MSRTGGTLLAVCVFVTTLISCDVIFPDCGGARNLRAEHEKALECAGWLEFVSEHVGEVLYRDVIELDGSEHRATGRAYCRSCRVEIAALEPGGTLGMGRVPRSPVEVAGILVHEAAHLSDGCKGGEGPAEDAERAFHQDYWENRERCRSQP